MSPTPCPGWHPAARPPHHSGQSLQGMSLSTFRALSRRQLTQRLQVGLPGVSLGVLQLQLCEHAGGLPAAALCSVGLLCSFAAPGAAKPALPALGLLVLGDSAPTQSSKASR